LNTKILNYPKRGEIYLIDLNFGKIRTGLIEIWGVRPCVVVSTNGFNKFSKMVTVVPLSRIDCETGRKKIRKTDIEIRKEEADLVYNSKIVVNQIMSIDIERIRKRLGEIDDDKLQLVKQKLTCLLLD
jgi:mRNA interferase MazF